MLNTDGSYLRLHLLNSKLQMISIGGTNMPQTCKTCANPAQGRFPLYLEQSLPHLYFSIVLCLLTHLPGPVSHNTLSTVFCISTSHRRLIRCSPKRFHPQKKIQLIKNCNAPDFNLRRPVPGPHDPDRASTHVRLDLSILT